MKVRKEVTIVFRQLAKPKQALTFHQTNYNEEGWKNE
jgi:hypothetical protein